MGRSLLDRFGSPKVSAGKPKSSKPFEKNKLGIATPSDDTNALSDKDWYAIHRLWRSSLFSDYYVKNELKLKKSREMAEFDSGFQVFLQQFRELCQNRQNEAFKSWKESDTIESWIMPVMQALGWWDNATDPCVREATISGPDGRSFFLDRLFVQKPSLKKPIQENKGAKQLDYARKHGILALEAKYWDRFQKYSKGEIGNKEDKLRSDIGGKDSPSALSPSGQILAYLKILKNQDPPRNNFGIVTDGRTWRLHHVDFPEDKFYEFDLGGLLFQLKTQRGSIEDAFQNDPKIYSWYVEAAKFFYYFFSKDVLFKDSEPTFVDDVLKHRQGYVERAEDDLRERFIDAMKYACNGLKRASSKERVNLDLSAIRNLAESHLFNILFIKSCEARGVLPLYTNYKEHSLTYIVERLRQFDPSLSDSDNEDPILKRAFGATFKNEGSEIYDQILELTKMIEDGVSKKSDYEISGFKESVFTREEKLLRQKVKLSNIEMVRVIFALGYLNEDNVWKQIPFNIFTTRQLGSIYESLLEFELEDAEEDLEFTKKQWKPISKSTSDKLKSNQNISFPVARKGELFFTPNNAKRKFSGSYYTPDDVVQYILGVTLEPLLKGKKSEELKKIKVCDPAAGSGHFLSAALTHLTKYFLEALHEESASKSITAPEANRIMLDHCIFGADLNPRAIKLAKMSLWLDSAQSSIKLENLDHHLVCGDSLIDDQIGYEHNLDWGKVFFSERGFSGFNVIIGNPPYVFTRDKKLGNQKIYLTSKYKWSRYQVNICEAFTERAMALLVDGGRLGYILPNTWLTITTTDSFRKCLKASSSELLIINCKDKIFKSAHVDNAIISAVKRESDPKRKSKIQLGIMERGKVAIISEKEEIPNGGAITIAKGSSSLVKKMEKTAGKLGQKFNVKSGLMAYEVGKGTPTQTSGMKEARVYHSRSKKNSRCRKYLDGSDVCRFAIRWSGQYLEYGNNLAAPRDISLFEGPRVLVRQIPSPPPFCMNAAVVTGNELNDRNSVIVKVESEDDAHLVAAILNSRLISQWFVEKFDKFQRKVFPQFKVGELAQFPFPSEIPAKTRKEIILISKAIAKKISESEKDSRTLDKLNEHLELLIREAFGY